MGKGRRGLGATKLFGISDEFHSELIRSWIDDPDKIYEECKLDYIKKKIKLWKGKFKDMEKKSGNDATVTRMVNDMRQLWSRELNRLNMIPDTEYNAFISAWQQKNPGYPKPDISKEKTCPHIWPGDKMTRDNVGSWLWACHSLYDPFHMWVITDKSSDGSLLNPDDKFSKAILYNSKLSTISCRSDLIEKGCDISKQCLASCGPNPNTFSNINCYICDKPITEVGGNHAKGGSCEHVVPVAEMAILCGLSGKDYERSIDSYFQENVSVSGKVDIGGTGVSREEFDQWRRLLLGTPDDTSNNAKGGGSRYTGVLYRWSHPACNEIKVDLPFLDLIYTAAKDDAEWDTFTNEGWPLLDETEWANVDNLNYVSYTLAGQQAPGSKTLAGGSHRTKWRAEHQISTAAGVGFQGWKKWGDQRSTDIKDSTLNYAKKILCDTPSNWHAVTQQYGSEFTGLTKEEWQKKRTKLCELSMSILDWRIAQKIKHHYERTLGVDVDIDALQAPWRNEAWTDMVGVQAGGGPWNGRPARRIPRAPPRSESGLRGLSSNPDALVSGLTSVPMMSDEVMEVVDQIFNVSNYNDKLKAVNVLRDVFHPTLIGPDDRTLEEEIDDRRNYFQNELSFEPHYLLQILVNRYGSDEGSHASAMDEEYMKGILNASFPTREESQEELTSFMEYNNIFAQERPTQKHRSDGPTIPPGSTLQELHIVPHLSTPSGSYSEADSEVDTPMSQAFTPPFSPIELTPLGSYSEEGPTRSRASTPPPRSRKRYLYPVGSALKYKKKRKTKKRKKRRLPCNSIKSCKKRLTQLKGKLKKLTQKKRSRRKGSKGKKK